MGGFSSKAKEPAPGEAPAEGEEFKESPETPTDKMKCNVDRAIFILTFVRVTRPDAADILIIAPDRRGDANPKLPNRIAEVWVPFERNPESGVDACQLLAWLFSREEFGFEDNDLAPREDEEDAAEKLGAALSKLQEEIKDPSRDKNQQFMYENLGAAVTGNLRGFYQSGNVGLVGSDSPSVVGFKYLDTVQNEEKPVDVYQVTFCLPAMYDISGFMDTLSSRLLALARPTPFNSSVVPYPESGQGIAIGGGERFSFEPFRFIAELPATGTMHPFLARTAARQLREATNAFAAVTPLPQENIPSAVELARIASVEVSLGESNETIYAANKTRVPRWIRGLTKPDTVAKTKKAAGIIALGATMLGALTAAASTSAGQKVIGKAKAKLGTYFCGRFVQLRQNITRTEGTLSEALRAGDKLSDPNQKAEFYRKTIQDTIKRLEKDIQTAEDADRVEEIMRQEGMAKMDQLDAEAQAEGIDPAISMFAGTPRRLSKSKNVPKPPARFEADVTSTGLQLPSDTDESDSEFEDLF